VKRAGPDVVLVAHSLACLAVAHWAAAKPHSPIKAALLVAIPNSKGPNFPMEARGFSETPTEPFSFWSTVVVSDDDHTARRNTLSNLRRFGEAASFISVIAVTSTQIAASAHGQRAMTCSIN
jgi:predicted alpha/beta hydrolase family esterase